MLIFNNQERDKQKFQGEHKKLDFCFFLKQITKHRQEDNMMMISYKPRIEKYANKFIIIT